MQKLQKFLISVLIFLFPLFFLNITQEFFFTNKFYLLGFGILLVLLLMTVNFIMTRKLSWRSTPFDTPLILFLITLTVSALISSPNRIQAFLNPQTGLGIFLFLTILYFVISNLKFKISNLLNWSALLLSVVTIFFFFNPLAKVNLPANLLFLKSPGFTPTGSPIDLLLFLGFFTVAGLVENTKFFRIGGTVPKKFSVLRTVSWILIAVAFIFTAYTIFKPVSPSVKNSNLQIPNSIFQSLPPYSVSWFAAIETLKNPKTALFGVGLDNFAALYTKVKPPTYNNTKLWNVNFTQSRSLILQVWAEAGLLGLAAFVLIIITLLRNADYGLRTKSWYLLLAFLLFPPSLLTIFLLYAVIAEKGLKTESTPNELDLSKVIPVLAGAVIVFLGALGVIGYFLGRSYIAEYYFKKGLDGFAHNNAKQLYDNVRTAINNDPYIERYRSAFAQVNLLIANNIAAKTTPKNPTDKPQELSAQDRQTVTQAVQTAINEAKAAVALNSQKATSWETLAIIYRNLINAAQGADTWTVAAYQRAIFLDPNNPIYRLNLGGVYYSLKNYDEAAGLFEQAVVLKPDWSNAHYNLAWANYQRANYTRASSEMQNVLTLLSYDKSSVDYKKANAEFEQFKKKIPAETKAGSQLNVPTPPKTTVEPKLTLPKNASPEAR